MAWFRVDNRLVHGQVIEGWLPYLDATRLVVINDSLATDELKQQIMMLAIPERITVNYVSIADAMPFFVDLENKTEKYLFLFDSCRDVIRLIEQGVTIKVLNVGNLHYAKGKRQICPHVAASKEDLACFDRLRERGVELDFRCVPGDTPRVENW